MHSWELGLRETVAFAMVNQFPEFDPEMGRRKSCAVASTSASGIRAENVAFLPDGGKPLVGPIGMMARIRMHLMRLWGQRFDPPEGAGTCRICSGMAPSDDDRCEFCALERGF
jgi:hypothetical protein